MTHFFEKTIVEAKDIYTEYLINVLQPLIYEGFNSIYEKAVGLEKTYTDASKVDANVKNPGVLILFQHFLLGIDKLNDNLIEEESKRMRDNSRCADIFDDLIKAVIKSHIIVLTYTASGKRCKIVAEKLHEKVETKIFIHKCYVECARIFYDHPTLFWHEFSNSELKENQRIIYQLVKIGIKNAIKRTLPMKSILEEYLKNDYVEESENTDGYMKVKDLLRRDLEGGNKDDGGIMKILDSESSMDNNILKLEKDVDDISALVYNRHIMDTLDGTNSPEKELEKQEQKVIDNPIIVEMPTQNPVETKNDNIEKPIVPVTPAPIKMEKTKLSSKGSILFNAINLAKQNAKNETMEQENESEHNEINVVKRKGNIEELDNYYDEVLNN